MKRLVVLPFLLFALACYDEMPVQPELGLLPEVALVQRAGPESGTLKMVPLKGEGTWEWDGIILAPGERCQNAGGMAEAHFTGSLNLTHLGLTTISIVQCYDFTVTPPQVFTRETFTAANGDQLVLYEDATPLDPVPSGFDWGYDFVVECGTGRFAGATGEGIAVGTVEPTPTGLRGKEVINGTVSSVGSAKRN